MAFFDFLGQGVGGTTPINQNTMVTNTAGQPVGPTWGQAIGTGLQYGSPQGSKTPAYGSTLANSSLSQPQLLPMPDAQQKQAGMKEQDSLSQIVSLLASLFTSGV